MKLVSLATSVASTLILCVSAASAQTGARLNAPAAEQELQLKAQGQAETPRTLTPNDTVTYNGTIAAAPVFNRPTSCAALSGAGTAVGFDTRSFTVSLAGSYTLEVTTFAGDSFLALYSPSFSPAAALTNCVAVDDDGGVGLLSRITANLTAGTQYVLVTTTFGNGVTGAFTNTLSGPGIITVGAPPATANVGITINAPTGVASSGPFTYVVNASNAGPDAAAGVSASINIGTGATVTGNSCGATGAGGTLTWNIGTLANGATAACTINVTAGTSCTGVAASASITTTSIDPALANNSSSTTNQATTPLPEGGFEGGSPNPVWAEASSNFGSPICSVALCGTGGGSTGPRSGAFWVWFGGFGGGTETGSVQQSVAIPTGTTSLTFGSRLGLCNNGASDFVRLTIDGVEVWRRNSTDASCPAAVYTTNSINVAGLAGPTPRVIRFESTTIGGMASNFSIDDVAFQPAPVCSAPTGTGIPPRAVDTLSRYGLFALLLGVLAIGFVVLQRRKSV